MSYKRKTKDVWKLIWNGECIDSFDTKAEARAMQKEYTLAFHSYVEVKRGREYV